MQIVQMQGEALVLELKMAKRDPAGML
jgi:hypothetical protein